MTKKKPPFPGKNQGLGIPVGTGENRIFSYTNKKSAFYCDNVYNPDEQMWYAGWNIAGKRIVAGYRLFLNGDPLEKSSAEVNVYPDRMVRRYEKLETYFSLIDQQEILVIGITSPTSASTGISLDPNLIEFIKNSALQISKALVFMQDFPGSISIGAGISLLPYRELVWSPVTFRWPGRFC